MRRFAPRHKESREEMLFNWISIIVLLLCGVGAVLVTYYLWQNIMLKNRVDKKNRARWVMYDPTTGVQGAIEFEYSDDGTGVQQMC